MSCSRLHIDFLHQVVLLRVLLELVTNRAHDVLNLRLEELAERQYRDRLLLRALLLDPLLVFQDGGDLRIVVSIFFGRLAVV